MISHKSIVFFQGLAIVITMNGHSQCITNAHTGHYQPLISARTLTRMYSIASRQAVICVTISIDLQTVI